ncbi:hypothetical protein TYRP_000420 [Tyrophagus putrescentiae]|nr:hypothetical protein TYRP_000420 [Tyrophagus putrescentiae]
MTPSRGVVFNVLAAAKGPTEHGNVLCIIEEKLPPDYCAQSNTQFRNQRLQLQPSTMTSTQFFNGIESRNRPTSR